MRPMWGIRQQVHQFEPNPRYWPWPSAILQRALDQGDVHPAAELVRRVLDGADRLEAEALVQAEAGSVVGRHRRHDGLAAGRAGLLDQPRQELLAHAPALEQ